MTEKKKLNFRWLKIITLILIGYYGHWLQDRCGISNGVFACDLWSPAYEND